MWAQWEEQQSEIISRVEKLGRRRVRNSYPGDSSPGSVISTMADTPFSGAVSDDGGQVGHDDEPGGVMVQDHMRMDGPTKHTFSNLSRREIKEAKMRRNAQRLERRLRRMGVGKSKKGRKLHTSGLSAQEKDIDKSSFVSNVLLRARLARPCSYCHVPYHHRLAPFTNMKLV